MTRGNFEKTLKVPKILVGWAGILIFPKQHECGVENLRKSCIFYFNLTWLSSAALGELYWFTEALYAGRSFEELCTCVPCFTMCVLAAVKFSCLYFNRDVVKKVVNKLKVIHPEHDEEELNNAKEDRKILKNDLRFLHAVTMFFCCSAVVSMLIFSAASILSMVYDYVSKGKTEFKLPFSVKYFFEVSNMHRWMLTYVHQVGAMMISCVQLLSTDVLFYSLCSYLQIHFRLLCIKFENVVSKNCSTETRENFRFAVSRHQELIRLVEQIELLYSKSILCNIISSSLLICLSGFIVTFVHDTGAVASFLMFLLMNLTQISLLCLFGEMLSSASTKIPQAVYNSVWYDTETDFKKSILLVIIRAQKPCKLTAMKFADLNLNALSAILKTSWSYFALLKTMYD